MRRGRVYYAKLAGGRSMFVASRLIGHFASISEPEYIFARGLYPAKLK